MIPKKIHYCWFGNNEIPEISKKCIDSWKKFLPEYQIIKHDESNTDLETNDYIKEAYANKEFAFVSDYIRLKSIYDEGGIYFDTDVELIKRPNSKMLRDGFFAKEDKKHINTGLGFAADKKDRTVKKMMDAYSKIHFCTEGNNKLDKTPCPIRNTKSIEAQISKTKSGHIVDGKIIYEKEFFSPLNWKNGKIEKTKNTYAIHYGNASWVDGAIKDRLKKRYEHIDKYGEKLGILIFKIKRLFRIIR